MIQSLLCVCFLLRCSLCDYDECAACFDHFDSVSDPAKFTVGHAHELSKAPGDVRCSLCKAEVRGSMCPLPSCSWEECDSCLKLSGSRLR